MTQHSEQAAWLQLSITKGLGPAAMHSLLDHFGSADSICGASQSALTSAGLMEPVANNLLSPDSDQLNLATEWLLDPSHHLIHWQHPDYPPLLRECEQTPFALFVQGDPILLSLPQIAVVGSRNATANGCETAALFAHHLSDAGFIITSGLALGIDSAAHLASLKLGKATIAVCGTGLDQVYPAQNVPLASNIQQQGALVSEFSPGTNAHKEHFPRRNRIISGLSLGTLVVEAGSRSGALITARFAAEQGREVFAIPGSIHSPQSKGCHRLIKQGAKLIETADEIIEELGPLAITAISAIQGSLGALNDKQSNDSGPLSFKKPLNSAAKQGYEKLLTMMGWDPVNVDALVERSGLTAEEVSSMLLIMELENRVDSLSGGRYQRKAKS
ncbi:MAG: DNA-processing protein DprA [Gammaproteobacteria bacterium]|nr:DNA-processing protein DprA [Gammaproteobacteria bacterium]